MFQPAISIFRLLPVACHSHSGGAFSFSGRGGTEEKCITSVECDRHGTGQAAGISALPFCLKPRFQEACPLLISTNRSPSRGRCYEGRNREPQCRNDAPLEERDRGTHG